MMTAKEMTAEIQRLNYTDRELWEHTLPSGVAVRVRCMPRRQLGVWYLVWATGDSPRVWCSKKLTAMTPETAGKKARSLVTKYQVPPDPDVRTLVYKEHR